MSEDYERTLVQLPQVYVFKIPARKSADGHRASDWPTTPQWTGKLKILAKGKTAMIVLHDDKNQTFAICPVTDDSCVEKTVDSGRYFVLKIQNAQGRHAFIGIAFNERNDAFDFNVALADHKSECERDEKAHETESTPEIHRDLRFKEGEKIQIKIGNSNRREKKSGGGGGLLAPPGSSLLSPPGSKSGPTSPSPTSSFEFSGFDSFSSSSSSSPSSDPFGSDPFGSDPFASSTPAPAKTSDPFASSSVDPFGFPVSSPSPPTSSSGSLLDF